MSTLSLQPAAPIGAQQLLQAAEAPCQPCQPQAAILIPADQAAFEVLPGACLWGEGELSTVGHWETPVALSPRCWVLCHVERMWGGFLCGTGPHLGAHGQQKAVEVLGAAAQHKQPWLGPRRLQLTHSKLRAATQLGVGRGVSQGHPTVRPSAAQAQWALQRHPLGGWMGVTSK